MLREALPEIVTGSVPGPKAAELLKRRDAAIPKAMCGILIRSVWEEEREPCWKMWMGTVSLTGSVVSVF